MEINKVNLKWNGKLKNLDLKKVIYIMIHHTAHPTWGIDEVHSFHQRTRGWAGIGYNFFVEKDGTIEEGRGLHVGAGATNYNYNSVHICFAGNFEVQTPTKEQIEAGKWLINHLLNLLPNKVRIIGHRDIGNTSCPRQKLSFGRI